jgi:hypothetical protein
MYEQKLHKLIGYLNFSRKKLHNLHSKLLLNFSFLLKIYSKMFFTRKDDGLSIKEFIKEMNLSWEENLTH